MEFIGPELPLFPISSANSDTCLEKFFTTNDEIVDQETARVSIERMQSSLAEELDYIDKNNPEVNTFINLTQNDIGKLIGEQGSTLLMLGMFALHHAARQQDGHPNQNMKTVTPDSLDQYWADINITRYGDQLVPISQGPNPIEEMYREFTQQESFLNSKIDEINAETRHKTAIKLGMAIMRDFLQFSHTNNQT